MGQYAEDWRTLHNFLSKYGPLFEGARNAAAKADSLDDACAALETKLATLQAQVAEAEGKLALTSTRLAAVDTEVTTQRTTKLEALGKEVAAEAEKKYGAINEIVAGRQAEVARLAAQAKAAGDQVTAKERYITQLQDQIVSLESTVAKLAAKKAEILQLASGG